MAEASSKTCNLPENERKRRIRVPVIGVIVFFTCRSRSDIEFTH